MIRRVIVIRHNNLLIPFSLVSAYVGYVRENSRANEEQLVVAIVGGGASGALTAHHIRRLLPRISIIVIDPHSTLGLGLAYSTPSLQHLLNVPAIKMSALPDQPDHFLEWLRKTGDPNATPDTFAPRAVFGHYIQSIVQATPVIEHVCAFVLDCRLRGTGTELELDNGRVIKADWVIVATGNHEPAPLRGVTETATRNRTCCHDAWSPDVYEGLTENDPITLVGSGLTAVDVILRFRELGHRGIITAVSRSGLAPCRHAHCDATPEPLIPLGTQPSCRVYLRSFHQAIRNGVEWRAAVDSLRPITNDLWLALSIGEQKRFRRHLQRRWEVVRHRMAPRIANVVDNELTAGTLVIRAGSLHSIESAGSGAVVNLHSSNGVESFATARVINCTGPNINYRSVTSPFISNLFAQSLVTQGPLGTGFNCTQSGALLDANGVPSRILFSVGPARLGTLIESIAIPEIREQAVDLAKLLCERVSQHKDVNT